MTIDELAALILQQQRERIARHYSQWQADAERVNVKPGPKYTKIDRGPEHNMSGFLMIDNADRRHLRDQGLRQSPQGPLLRHARHR